MLLRNTRKKYERPVVGPRTTESCLADATDLGRLWYYSGPEMRVYIVELDGRFTEFEQLPFDVDHVEAGLKEWLEVNPDGDS